MGVLIDSDLKFSSHTDVIVTKAHQHASLILRCFKCTLYVYPAMPVLSVLIRDCVMHPNTSVISVNEHC